MTENDAIVVTGIVRTPENIDAEWINIDSSTLQNKSFNSNSSLLSTKDFYKVLRLRGYHYKGLFKKVLNVNHDGKLKIFTKKFNFTSIMFKTLYFNRNVWKSGMV